MNEHRATSNYKDAVSAHMSELPLPLMCGFNMTCNCNVHRVKEVSAGYSTILEQHELRAVRPLFEPVVLAFEALCLLGLRRSSTSNIRRSFSRLKMYAMQLKPSITAPSLGVARWRVLTLVGS